MKPQIWFIHGAASTPLSFNWLKAKLRRHDAIDISYESQTPLVDTISYIRNDISKCAQPPIIIGHSLGGVIAASVAQVAPVKQIITLGTPFGGSFAASVMRWFMPTQLMRDISQQSPILASLQNDPPQVPILSFVTDSGLNVMGERTDGVVTVRSQMALKGPNYIVVPNNHFEVLLDPAVATQINTFIGGAK